MEVRKSKLSMYLIISLLIFTFCINNASASEYVNYYGITMTSQEYNNVLGGLILKNISPNPSVSLVLI